MSVGFFALFLLLVGPQGSAKESSYRLQAEPRGDAEAALRAALGRAAFAGASGVGELLQVSLAHPGTAASGLAQLATGLLLLESDKPAESLLPLRHPDLARTALPDLGGWALGRALVAAGDSVTAAASFLAAADARPDGPWACPALFDASDALGLASRPDDALAALLRALDKCPSQKAKALLAIGRLQESRRDLKAAAEAYDRLDSQLPASDEAQEARQRLASLAHLLSPQTPEARATSDLARGAALLEAGQAADAVRVLRSIPVSRLPQSQADLLRVGLGRAYFHTGRVRDAEREVAAVASGSPHEAEAAYLLARCRNRRTQQPDLFEAVATRFPGTTWGEDALLALANHYQKDSRSDEAVPYFQKLLAAYPDGRYSDRSAWRVAWADYRMGRYDESAQLLERAARTHPVTVYTAGFLYWAGRARYQQGQKERSARLFEETVARFKHTYYGRLAGEALVRLGLPASPPAPALDSGGFLNLPEIAEPQLTRARQLLLIDRLDEAQEELTTIPATPRVQATLAWIDWRRGRFRPAITGMKRAFPEFQGEAGQRLPEEIWRILYPLEFSGLLLQKSADEGLDPALVAAVICQESSFNPGAVSSAGARGLMQVIPRTGRTVARSLGMRYQAQSLLDPTVSLKLGTRYLRQMLDRFDGRVERALAAYNAGPHRVEAWTRDDPEIGAEEFIESIPFSETRTYVILILGSQEQYRRIYGLPGPTASKARTEAMANGRP